MIKLLNIALQHRIDSFLTRKFKEYPDLENSSSEPGSLLYRLNPKGY